MFLSLGCACPLSPDEKKTLSLIITCKNSNHWTFSFPVLDQSKSSFYFSYICFLILFFLHLISSLLFSFSSSISFLFVIIWESFSFSLSLSLSVALLKIRGLWSSRALLFLFTIALAVGVFFRISYSLFHAYFSFSLCSVDAVIGLWNGNCSEFGYRFWKFLFNGGHNFGFSLCMQEIATLLPLNRIFLVEYFILSNLLSLDLDWKVRIFSGFDLSNILAFGKILDLLPCWVSLP